MSLKGRFLSVLTLAAALAAFGTVSYAQQTSPQQDNSVQKQDKEGRGWRKQGQFGRRGMRGGHGGFGMLRGIELTDAQKAQIKTIMDANRPSEGEMQEMKSIMETRRNGGTLTDDQKARIKELREQHRAKFEAVHQQILAILTPEQKQQLEQRQQEMKQRRELRRQQRQTEKTTTTDDSSNN